MKPALLLVSALWLSACGSELYTIALVPVPAYLNEAIPANVPKLASVDEEFSSADTRLLSSISGTTTTTVSWSTENYMASGVYEAAQEVANDGGQPVFVNCEFQVMSKWASGVYQDYGWFDGHLMREE